MRYKKRQVVAGVKIISYEIYQKYTPRKKANGEISVRQERQYRYITVNKTCGCEKEYTSLYLRSLDLSGNTVKCMSCERRKKDNRGFCKPNIKEFSPMTDAYAVDSIVRPKTLVSGFVWGMQGLDNLRSYRLAIND